METFSSSRSRKQRSVKRGEDRNAQNKKKKATKRENENEKKLEKRKGNWSIDWLHFERRDGSTHCWIVYICIYLYADLSLLLLQCGDNKRKGDSILHPEEVILKNHSADDDYDDGRGNIGRTSLNNKRQ